ncbi:MAG: hypothetical protein ABMA00_01885 [Gemmatimonas sp.]
MANWLAARERRHRAQVYLQRLLIAPDASDIAWLGAIVGDRDVAERELIFARRALGLIVAERDALDDRTAADVAHALTAVIEAEARRSAAVARHWIERRRAYTAAMAVRGQSAAPAARFGRVLLEGAGVAHPSDDALARAEHFVQVTRTQANEALRAVFGVASMPEDVRPSAIRP